MVRDAGLDVKGLYGQWGHDYPDRRSGHEGLSSGRGAEAFPYTLRWDWADDLLEWFDYYLREMGPKPRLIAEVQDNMGGWRVEETYPPLDSVWVAYGMDQWYSPIQTRVGRSGLKPQVPTHPGSPLHAHPDGTPGATSVVVVVCIKHR